MKKPSVLAVFALIFSACLFISLIALAIYLIYWSPINEPMKVAPKPTSVGAVQVKPTATVAEKKPVEVCGNTGVRYLLFVGADFSKGVWPLGADSVRLVKIDYDNVKITAIAFPRDLYLKTPALEDLNKSAERLGLAYYIKKESTNGSDQHKVTVSTQLVAQTLLDNFTMPTPQNYLTLQLDTVPEMIDAVGGVEVSLPESITSDYKIVFPAGPQTLDGKLAMEYVRTYDPGGDPARLLRQNLFVKAMREQVLSDDTLLKLPDLFKTYTEKKVIITDLNLKQSQDLICMVETVPADKIIFHEIIGDMIVVNQDGSMTPNVDKINENIQKWLEE